MKTRAVKPTWTGYYRATCWESHPIDQITAHTNKNLQMAHLLTSQQLHRQILLAYFYVHKIAGQAKSHGTFMLEYSSIPPFFGLVLEKAGL